MIEQIKCEDISLETIAEKINELVDFANIILAWRVEELEKDMNAITYGARITDEQKISDMKFRTKLQETIYKCLIENK